MGAQSVRRVLGWLVAGASAVLAACWALGHQRRRAELAEREARVAAWRIPRRPGQRFLVLAGEAGVGKSALANALLGTDLFDGASAPSEAAQWRDQWWVRELPADAVALADAGLLRPLLGDQDVLVLVVAPEPVAGQLSAAEEAFLGLLRAQFPKLTRLVFCNKADRFGGQLPAEAARRVKEALRLAAGEEGAWGAANGLAGPDITDFVQVLEARLATLTL